MTAAFPFKHILITGGAGFVGSHLALAFRESFENLKISILDNLVRRGSELNLQVLLENDLEFYHGDIRCREDFDKIPPFDLMIDCSAEPSVQAGLDGKPDHLIQNNLNGTLNCLEMAHRNNAAFIFLSTSRVYPITPLAHLPFNVKETRFAFADSNEVTGWSAQGISEDFTLQGARSFYGASKLSGELMLQEYAYTYNMKAIINRCGILAGSRQMGKVDQGVITLWMARHLYEKKLSYIGFGGEGKQVRDILHPKDLFFLLLKQLEKVSDWNGQVYNVGGGNEISLSLRELTDYCQNITGKKVNISAVPETSPVDIPLYISDSRKAQQEFQWMPKYKNHDILEEIYQWMSAHKDQLRAYF
ncbi:MAG: NAD-dependent epimerase/dehydratase family protein [Planctomycetes bacterium]|nr:NAD-dependent epimerase/dehydratase family protein [Planctomycetota bacterium]